MLLNKILDIDPRVALPVYISITTVIFINTRCQVMIYWCL